jgi:hypothetical protein
MRGSRLTSGSQLPQLLETISVPFFLPVYLSRQNFHPCCSVLALYLSFELYLSFICISYRFSSIRMRVAARFASRGDSRSFSAAVSSSTCSPQVRLLGRSGPPSPACDCAAQCAARERRANDSSSPQLHRSRSIAALRPPPKQHSVTVVGSSLLPSDLIRSGLFSAPPRLVSWRHHQHRVSVRAAPAFLARSSSQRLLSLDRGPCGNRMAMRSSHWLSSERPVLLCSRTSSAPLCSPSLIDFTQFRVHARPRQIARVVSLDWSLSPPARLDLAQTVPSFGIPSHSSSSPGWPKRIYTTLSRRSSTRA